MAFPYRLAAIDIDDTLVGPDKQISSANRKAIHSLQQMGVRIVLASGRGAADMQPFHDELGLSGPMICVQGALAIDVENRHIIHQSLLPIADAQALAARGIANGLTVFLFTQDAVIAPAHTPWVEQFVRERSAPPTIAEDLQPHLPRALKIVVAGPPTQITKLAARLPAEFAGRLDPVITCPHYLEFNAHGTNKSLGLAAVTKFYGIDRREVLAFGDGNNDVAMLRWAGLGVAMANGLASAKAAAHRVGPAGDPETVLAGAIEMVVNGVSHASVKRIDSSRVAIPGSRLAAAGR